MTLACPTELHAARVQRASAWVQQQIATHDSSHDWFHIERVTNAARSLAAAEGLPVRPAVGRLRGLGVVAWAGRRAVGLPSMHKCGQLRMKENMLGFVLQHTSPLCCRPAPLHAHPAMMPAHWQARATSPPAPPPPARAAGRGAAAG